MAETPIMPTRHNSDNQESTYLKNAKAWVRVAITFLAAIFLFGGGAGMIWFYLKCCPDQDQAKDIFHAILPISAGIISFWFAGRLALKKPSQDQ